MGISRRGTIAAVAVLLAGTVAAAHPVLADDDSRTKSLRKKVTLAGVREHQAAFQAASDGNGGNRIAGSPGFEASAEYVASRLQAAGYTVQSQWFEFPFNADRTPPALQEVAPNQRSYVDGVDFASMTYSPNGDVTAPVWAVDLVLPAPPTANSNTSGCEASDFAGFPAGAIALMQRGSCNFVVKAANAAAAGASGSIIFNEGQPDRSGVLSGTLGGPQSHSAPAVGTSHSVGLSFANGVQNGDTGTTARVRVDRTAETRTTRNLIAETIGGDASNVVVVGAHLDSVSRGPGINDNGSGSAAILEVAEELGARGDGMANKVRFVWWGAEELGLLGSQYYVSNLSAEARDAIALNLNFDMIGSPNPVRFVYDGDNSAFAPGTGVMAGTEGSGEIERVFRDYYTSQGLASAETPLSGRSDYGPFLTAGIPAGGLFTGAEGIKSAAEAAVFGGTAGVAYDPCYHLACDTYANVDNAVLDQNADAVVHAVLHFGLRDFVARPLVDPLPAGPGGSPSSGGLHDDHDHEAVAS